MTDAAERGSNAVDGIQVFGGRADDRCAAVIEEVLELLGRQAVVERHQHGADLRHGVERFQLRVGVGRNVGDAIARFDSERLQRGGPAIHPREELAVGPSSRPIYDCLAIVIEPPRSMHELEW